MFTKDQDACSRLDVAACHAKRQSQNVLRSPWGSLTVADGAINRCIGFLITILSHFQPLPQIRTFRFNRNGVAEHEHFRIVLCPNFACLTSELFIGERYLQETDDG